MKNAIRPIQIVEHSVRQETELFKKTNMIKEEERWEDFKKIKGDITTKYKA